MKVLPLIAAMALGGALTYGALQIAPSETESTATSSEKEPLYWVAPMDPNYRRDEPGKSPMGMDLIPFYGDEGGAQMGAGTVSIAPEVVNNLGVRTALAERGQLSTQIRSVGYLDYNEEQISHVHPRVEGWVEKSFIKDNGAQVAKDAPLFDLYSPTLVNAQEEFVFALNRRDSRMVKAARERLQALQVPQRFIERLEQTRKVSQAVRFYAPRAGVVDNLSIQDGFYVTPSKTLMSIANLSELWLEAEVFERQASWVRVGQPVTAKLDFLPGQSFQSEVDFIYPTLDPTTRTLKVRVRLDNPEGRLKPKMFAHINIAAKGPADALLVPKEAVIRGADQQRVVLALGEGRFKSIAVEVGAFSESQAQILSGLKDGDRVVTSAQFLLDSESSKTSDFKRMASSSEHAEMSDMEMAEMAQTEQQADVETVPENVWVKASVNSIDTANGKLNVNHGPIPEWDWPEMTMDFYAAEWLELEAVPLDTPLQLEIIRESSTRYSVSDFYATDEL
ncbi:efflux RND transporter periplasmic adaptor subunit [Marinomonas ostreistagni]|uniref:efflux RND transporter periplasmic adaptor subunit n=1 Tax=Marinomonas ostreistagni TaxID=359209 RepID=UPI001950D874|nr:efflux RND transporter periplasmic adaptor subunit [Marinomonas ostreistagni]MBM6550350.1 efflux RND transporter periplasmic adaptor subunit [Marinomonas ostreistagni]